MWYGEGILKVKFHQISTVFSNYILLDYITELYLFLRINFVSSKDIKTHKGKKYG